MTGIAGVFFLCPPPPQQVVSRAPGFKTPPNTCGSQTNRLLLNVGAAALPGDGSGLTRLTLCPLPEGNFKLIIKLTQKQINYQHFSSFLLVGAGLNGRAIVPDAVRPGG